MRRRELLPNTNVHNEKKRSTESSNTSSTSQHHGGSFGIYMSNKISKLRTQNTSFQSQTNPQLKSCIFTNIHIYIDGITFPSKEELRELILLHGGGFEHYQTSTVTHLIATHLPASKIQELRAMRSPPPVVHPNWIVQSIQQQKLLPIQPFLYKAFKDSSQRTIKLSFESQKMMSTGINTGNSTKINTVGVNTHKRLQSTRDGPEFVRQFFANSRLHHIGLFRTSFQEHLPRFRLLYQGPPMVLESPTSLNRRILHVDMDCFFVAVAMRDDTTNKLHTYPLAVAHSKQAGTSQISSCNYVARSRGVRSGMFMNQAKGICPELQVVPYNFEAIRETSITIYSIFYRYTPYVDATSCDEAFLEFPASVDAVSMAKAIREEIFAKTKCTASVGIASNLLLAKLATKNAKPNGIHAIGINSKSNKERELEIDKALTDLLLRDLPGVGSSAYQRLEQHFNVTSCKQLQSVELSILTSKFGVKTGKKIYDLCRGRDERPIIVEWDERKQPQSVSAVMNYGVRLNDWNSTREIMHAIAVELSKRLKNQRVIGVYVSIHIKKRSEGQPVEPSKYMGCGRCDNYSKSKLLDTATDDANTISETAISLLKTLHIPCEELRGLGIQLSKLTYTGTIYEGKSKIGASSSSRLHESPSCHVLQSWLNEKGSAQREDVYDKEVKETKLLVDENAKDEGSDTDLFAKGYSQIDKTVLDELPKSIQEEVIASYRLSDMKKRTNTSISFEGIDEAEHSNSKRIKLVTNQLPPKVPAEPKSRHTVHTKDFNFFNIHTPGNLTSNREHTSDHCVQSAINLDDLSMSQIDCDVYDALPFSIRREIDRSVKKSSSSCTRPKRKINENSSHENKCNEGKSQCDKLKPIEVLVTDLLVDIVSYDHISRHFESIYSRVFYEMEKCALDHVVRMLRYVRRKVVHYSGERTEFRNTNTEVDLNSHKNLLAQGFNQLLNQVNDEVIIRYNARVSSRVIKLIPTS